MLSAEEPFADNGSTDEADISAAILEYTKTKKLKWKNGRKIVRVSRSTKSLVEELLHPDPTMRLGMGLNGAEDIRNHSYFADFDWSSLRLKTLEIPFDWRPNPKLCSNDITIEHQDEMPLAALQRMKNEYTALREQYIRMVARDSAVISSGAGGVSRKRASEAPPATDLRRSTTTRRIDTRSDVHKGTSSNKAADRPVTPSRRAASTGLSVELFDF